MALTDPLPTALMLHERVYQVVRRAILQRELEPGASVNESWLARTLGVSRSPVRDAIQRLFREGLVARAPNGRYYVAMLSREDLDHVYAVRSALEALAAYVACTKATDRDVETLEEIVKREKEVAARHDPEGLLGAGTAFHGTIIALAGNPILSELIDILNGRTRPFTLKSAHLPSRETDAVHEHEQLVEAVRRRDSVTARKLMEDHLEQSRLRLLSVLDVSESLRMTHTAALPVGARQKRQVAKP